MKKLFDSPFAIHGITLVTSTLRIFPFTLAWTKAAGISKTHP
jgi:hypothetical protein